MYPKSVIHVFIFLHLTSPIWVSAKEQRKDENSITFKVNSFGMDMYDEIKRSVKGNIIFSPFSIFTAFTMLGVGAKGDTKSEMAKVFHWGNFELLLKEIKPMYKHITKRDGNGSFLIIANELWIAREMKILTTYQVDISSTFMGGIQTVNFSTNPEVARETINNWAEEKTENKIKNFFPSTLITNMTRLVVANAIYFKGEWHARFNSKDTEAKEFHLTDNKSVTVDFMTREGDYAVYNDKVVELLEIPYSGNKFSMIFMKPIKVNLDVFEPYISVNKINKWVKKLGFKKYRALRRVYIPKFQLDQSIEGLEEILTNLGISDLFIPDEADLSGIHGRRDLACSAAIHKSYIKVDDEGTVDAAATGIAMSRILPILPTPNVTIDRPFLFFVISKMYKAIVLSGRVMNPVIEESVISNHDIKNKQNSLLVYLYPMIATILMF